MELVTNYDSFHFGVNHSFVTCGTLKKKMHLNIVICNLPFFPVYNMPWCLIRDIIPSGATLFTSLTPNKQMLSCPRNHLHSNATTKLLSLSSSGLTLSNHMNAIYISARKTAFLSLWLAILFHAIFCHVFQ